MKIEEIIKHCEQAKEKFRETRLLATSSYYMGYHDMAAEILEILEATEENKGIEKSELPNKLLMHYNGDVEEEIMLNRARINMIIDYLESRDRE